MRLEEITLKNFGSFADATINLEKVSAGVVVGENGAGKSTAFIDAVLWALFGKCRVQTDAMIRLGATHMAVSVIFSLGGHRYRVTRQRSVNTKAGKSGLEVQMQGADGWAPISGAKLDDTQDKIERLLRLDYDLLTSTGFLVQGQADQFVRVKPTERKALLASILQLDRWGAWKGLATSEANREAGKLGILQVHADGLRLKAGEAEKLRASEIETADLLGKIQEALRGLEQQRAALTEQRNQLSVKIAGLHTYQEQQAKLRAERDRLNERETSLIGKQARYETIIEDAMPIRSAHAEVEAVRQCDTELADGVAKLDQEIQEIDRQVSVRQTAQHQRMSMQQTLATKQREMERLVEAYLAETDKLSGEIDRIRESTKLLTVVPCGADLQKQCQFTLQAVEAQNGLPAKAVSLAARKRQPGEIVEYVKPGLVAEVNGLVCDLAALPVVPPEELTRLSKERSGKVAERDQYGKRRRDNQVRIVVLVQQANRLSELEQAEQDLPAIDQEVVGVQSLLATAVSDLVQVSTILAQANGWQCDLHATTEALGTLSRDDARARAQERDCTKQLGQYQAQREAAEQANEEMQQVEQTILDHAQAERQYRLLSEAYAEIPVLVMETSMPILEQRANEILGMISTSGLSIRIDTQKALKSRDGLAETLEIIVRDGAGARPYEAYSGGERMRIDLAVRIALSDLLAQRAGAKLHTLVIDEAFAPLDVHGVEQMRQCLEAIQKLYPLILVITHDQRMKDTFGTPIVVSKTAAGSRIEVFG